MKTTYTVFAIFATILFSHTAAAKLGNHRPTNELDSKIQVNVQAEILDSMNIMLAKVQAAKINNDVVRQLKVGTIQLHTNELVQNVEQTLPEFNFKVIITD